MEVYLKVTHYLGEEPGYKIYNPSGVWESQT